MESSDNNDVTNFTFYYYIPSLVAASLFTTLFALATLLHAYQLLKTKTWFLIPLLLGSIFETIGYIGRILSANEAPGPYTLGPYIIQSVLILVAPALFAASIYMELGRIVAMVEGDTALFLRRTWLTRTFVTGDVFAFLMQASGAGLLGTGNTELIATGKSVVVAGLFAQLAFFGVFVSAAASFQIRISKRPTRLCFERPWRRHMLGLYVFSGLILVRSVVRVVEYLQGYDGFIISHEVFLYVFDAVPMFLGVVSMSWIHPGEVARHVRETEQKREIRGGLMLDGSSSA